MSSSSTALPDYGALINSQTIHTLPSFTLESGVVLEGCPIAYKTWGKLNERKDNVMVICHAFTGSADVEDWYVSVAYHSSIDGSLPSGRVLLILLAETDSTAGGVPLWVSGRHSIPQDVSYSVPMLWDHLMAPLHPLQKTPPLD
jgi:hypothetical protein